MPAKLTIDDAVRVFTERGFILLDTEYFRSDKPMRYICTCGKESTMSLKNAKKGKNCAECGRAKSAKTRTTPFHEVKELFDSAGATLLSTEYKHGIKLDYICCCGNHARINYHHAKHHGISCRSCGNEKIGNIKRKYTIEEVRKLFAEQGKQLLAESFTNSLTPMPYICKCGEVSAITLNNFFKGKDCSRCRNDKISEKAKDDSITDEERELRRSLRAYKHFRKGVFSRDDYTCQKCFSRGRTLNAHHILNFADNPEYRTDVDNGITFCEDCHKEFHKIYGYRNTTREQLLEFLGDGGDE